MPERSAPSRGAAGRPAGRSVVTRRAIVDIVRAAVQTSYGVIGFADPSFGARLARWLHAGRPGIVLSTEGGLNLDLYVTVAFGVPVAEVARQVDSAVRYALRRALGTEVDCLSIHVDGLRYQPTAPRREARREEPKPAETEATTAAPAPDEPRV